MIIPVKSPFWNVILAAFIVAMLVMIGACGFGRRLRVEGAIENLWEIRNAELDFRQINGRYGSLEELVSAGKLDDDLADGQSDGFAYSLDADNEEYELIVTDTKFEETAESERLSFYLDQTGIARVSLDPKSLADSHSDPLRPKSWGVQLP